MKILWIQTEHAFATWSATFDETPAAPTRMLDLLRVILAAGEAQRVFVPTAVPAIGYRRGETAAVQDLLEARWRDARVVDLAAFAAGNATIGASLCCYNAEDQIEEQFVTDLGATLRALEPVPERIPLGFTKAFPPIKLFGPVLRDAPGALPPRLRVSLHADIWFPYVQGAAHPHADFRRFFDNRALAECHTPRLNTFLAALADHVVAAGGSWRMVADETAPPMQPWVTDRGIALDAPAPSLMPAAALDAEWD